MYPYLIMLDNGSIKTYWALAAAGIIAGFVTLAFMSRSMEAKKRNTTFLFALLLFIPMIIGARAGFYFDSFILKTPYCLNPSFSIIGPVSLWWGLILAALCAFPLAYALKVSVWETTDHFAVPIGIGGFFTKAGCFFNGCCYGIEAPPSFPFAAVFPVFPYDPSAYIARYPVQLFESLSWLIIFFLLAAGKKYKHFHGEIILKLAIFFSISRFFTEFFRYHPEKHLFSISQYFSAIIFFTAVGLFILRLKTEKQHMKPG